MKLQIKTLHYERTPEINEYLEKRLAALEKFVDEDTLCDVELGRTSMHHQSGDVHRTEINIRFKGKEFRTVSEKSDIRAAIDEAKDEMFRELSSYEAKKRRLWRRGASRIKEILKGFRRE